MRKLLVLAALAALSCRDKPAPEPASRPNLVLITIDTLRADHCSAYGYGRDTTPVMARLAQEGARVELAYTPMPSTGPSHASMFTSLYPISHGYLRNGQEFAESQVTLAERLRDAGYRTSAVVSSSVLKAKFGFAQGFGTFRDRFPTTNQRRTADETTELALAWLAQRQRDKPFFLWVHYFDPHEPYQAKPPYDARYPAPAGDAVAAQVAQYDGEIAYTDEHMGRLLAAVERDTGGNTLVVVTADHGEGLMQHGFMGHGPQLYEEALRVPLVVRWPGHVTAGRVVPGPVELLDLAPTALELLGVGWTGPAPQGQSLAPALLGKAGGPGFDVRRAVFFQRRLYDKLTEMPGEEVKGLKLAARERGLKYIEAPEEGTRELFDLEADPREAANLAAAREADARRLSQLLARWRTAHDFGVRARDDRSQETDEALRALGYVR